MLTNLILFFMQWPQNAKTMGNYLSRIHQSQRMILILEAHSIVFLQQPDYDFICKSSLFLKVQSKNEAEEVNKRQALGFTRDTSSCPNLHLFYHSQLSDDSSPRKAFAFKDVYGLFVLHFYFIPEGMLTLAKHPTALLSPSKTHVNCWKERSNRKPVKAGSAKQNQQRQCTAR